MSIEETSRYIILYGALVLSYSQVAFEQVTDVPDVQHERIRHANDMN